MSQVYGLILRSNTCLKDHLSNSLASGFIVKRKYKICHLTINYIRIQVRQVRQLFIVANEDETVCLPLCTRGKHSSELAK